MEPEHLIMLGEHSARLASIEQRLSKVDSNVEFLVQRESTRAAKEHQTKIMLTTAGGFLGAIFAFIASIAKDWLLR